MYSKIKNTPAGCSSCLWQLNGPCLLLMHLPVPPRDCTLQEDHQGENTSQLICEGSLSRCSLIVQGRVLRALWGVHWSRLATAAGFRLLQNLCAWSGPFLLQQLLGHLQAGAAICKPLTPCSFYQCKFRAYLYSSATVAMHTNRIQLLPYLQPSHYTSAVY